MIYILQKYKLIQFQAISIVITLLIVLQKKAENVSNEIPNGVSIENASYIEMNTEQLPEIPNSEESLTESDLTTQDKEYTPKLFSNDEDSEREENFNEFSETHSDKLFDQDGNDEEDFEIPAFLRKQKF